MASSAADIEPPCEIATDGGTGFHTRVFSPYSIGHGVKQARAKARASIANLEVKPSWTRFTMLSTAIVVLISLASCALPETGPSSPEYFARSWPVMGTFAEVIIDDDDRDELVIIADEVHEILERVDETMSVYKPTSDISRVNAAAGNGSWTQVDTWLAECVARGMEARLMTGGAFSMNVLEPGIRLGLKPRESLPSFDPEKPAKRWGDDRIEVSMDPPRIRLLERGMGIDLGGIAKGFALDKAADALRRRGVRRFLLDLGRMVYVGDRPRDRSGWPVMIDGEERQRLIENLAIAVSRQGVASDTPHIVDPRTGDPVARRGWAVAEAREGWLADVASTAIFVDSSVASVLTRRGVSAARWGEPGRTHVLGYVRGN